VSTPSFQPTPTAASSPSYSAPSSSFSAPTITAPAVAPALPPEAQAPSVPQQTALPATTAAAAKDDNGPRGIAFLILLAGLAFAGLAYITPARAEDGHVGLGRFRRPVPAEALAAPVEPVQGGLGRFTRPRTGPPPALS
jgi:hypothetical protein